MDTLVIAPLIVVVLGSVAFPFAFARVSEGPGPLERRVVTLNERLGAVEAKQSLLTAHQDADDELNRQLANSRLRGDQLSVRLVRLEDQEHLIVWFMGTIAMSLLGLVISYVKQMISIRLQEESSRRREKKIDELHDITNGRMTEMIADIRRMLAAESVIAVAAARADGIAIGEATKKEKAKGIK